MKHPGYPGVSSMTDRHGKTRWRFRRSGHKDVMLPGEPSSPEFDGAYQAAIEGRASGVVIRLEGVSGPETLKAAYIAHKRSDEWRGHSLKTQIHYSMIIENLLRQPIGKEVFGDAPVADLRRRDIKDILTRYADTPFMERLVLIVLKKLTMTAIDEEWIEVDPCYGIKRSPHTAGHRAWGEEQLAMFERRWPIGTPQRTAYAIGLWLGTRVSDIARLRWSQLKTETFIYQGDAITIEVFKVRPFKGRDKRHSKILMLPVTPMLARDLAPLSREGEFVVPNEPRGGGYTDASLSMGMSRWAKAAGLGAGYTMHGLRKALGVKLAEADASTRQLMEVLGHNNIAFAELYSREASQLRLAFEGMEKVTTLEASRPGRPPHLTLVR